MVTGAVWYLSHLDLIQYLVPDNLNCKKAVIYFFWERNAVQIFWFDDIKGLSHHYLVVLDSVA